jgi:ribosomal protein L13E
LIIGYLSKYPKPKNIPKKTVKPIIYEPATPNKKIKKVGKNISIALLGEK